MQVFNFNFSCPYLFMVLQGRSRDEGMDEHCFVDLLRTKHVIPELISDADARAAFRRVATARRPRAAELARAWVARTAGGLREP